MQPGIVLPDLRQPYSRALAECVEEMLSQYDVVGIAACGTVIRGTPDPASDLDIHVLHRRPFRERIQKFFSGVPCEVFVNPPLRVARYFREEAAERRPMTAHMFATCFAVFDPDGIVEALSGEAKQVLSSAPQVGETSPRGAYGAATLFEDAEDLAARDPESAMLVLRDAIHELVQCRIEAEPGWLPRPKDAFARLRELDPKSASLAMVALTADLSASLDAGRQLCKRVTGATGFFEWTSPREVIDETVE